MNVNGRIMMNSLLVKLNSLYSELEYETNEDTRKKIKRQIYEIEKKLKEEKDKN